ncbi:DUF262 domain-containing HNH endonuclease family protein [Spirosoma sp. SC4-14]|uniref:DUF262 domain-containing protein n=1 Tax=Spirosoma sp. SC4-14 TaxID=3128900 RepID=UPI0030D3D512
MAINNLLDTNTVSFSDIIGNGKIYQVPVYQRNYSWKEDNWEDLWNDIVSLSEPESVHYMGSIVLQNQGEKKYTIIDGQQRLVTLSIIVFAVIKLIQELADKHIDEAANRERISLLSSKFLEDKDPASLTYSSKLSLNENNNSFYQSHLMVFRPPINERTLRDSDKLLWKAYNFFVNTLQKHFKSNFDGEKIATFLNKIIAERLMFIQIVVENEVSAYTVFETLNSRGVDLTVTDLLKNYLFSVSTRNDLVHVKEKWQRIVDAVGLDTFPAFLRHYWISKYKLIRQEYLFRAVKEITKTSIDVINLLDELEKNAQLYNALTNSSDPFWIGLREARKAIKELELFKERQALPLLLAVYNNLSQEEFIKTLRIVSIITFRYTVVSGLNTNPKEQYYSQTAIKVSRGECQNSYSIAQEFRPLYVSDLDFKNDFSTLSVKTKGKNRKLARYILFKIENQLSGADRDYEDDPATIEHILPENSDLDWLVDFPPAIQENYIYRIGNDTLLEEDKNRDCGTKSFTEKKRVYQTSQYTMSRTITANEWTPNTVDIRQGRLADTATAVWRLTQLD